MELFSRHKRSIVGVGVGALALVLAWWAFRPDTHTAAPRIASVEFPVPSPAPLAAPARVAKATQVRNAQPGVRHDYIVQASSVALARQAVEHVGGKITGELEIIRAVGASLDDREIEAMREKPVDGLHIYEDRQVTASSVDAPPETYYPTEIGATALHGGGTVGRNVTVAVIDSGIWHNKGPLAQTSYGRTPQVIAQYDVILAREDPTAYTALGPYDRDIDDLNGHGTHVSSIIASSAIATTGKYQGVAPGVNLVSVRALDATGAGRYFDVIRGIQWIVSHKTDYGVRVLNLSLSSPPQGHYWEDPLNQAVMAAWASGIVVVVAAGNRGPDAMTIGVPGNVPYVITVGAVTDSYHPDQPNKYRLATFSSAGPTYEGFVKPEVVAMGGHIRAYAPDNGTLAQQFPQWLDPTYDNFTMSGTSQAAAVTSGVVALMLSTSPTLTPNTVKCRLMSSAWSGLTADGHMAYSVFQQGAGLVNAHDAAYSTASGCANRGLNITLDMAGLQHYGGRANQDANGNYFIMGVQPTGLLGQIFDLLGQLLGKLLWTVQVLLDGLLWDGSPPDPNQDVTWDSGYVWSTGYTWADGYTWSNGYTWDSGYVWSTDYTGSSVQPGADTIQQE